MFWKLCYSVPVSFMLFCHIFSYGVFASLEISIPSNIYIERRVEKCVFSFCLNGCFKTINHTS